MKAITPNYVNDLAESIARVLEGNFPDTLFVILPTVAYGSKAFAMEKGIHFSIRAILSKEELARDPQMIQQSYIGEIVRTLTLKPEGQNLTALVAEMLTPLIDDLNRTILNPLG